MFMQPQVYFGQFFSVETSQGTEIVPADVIGRTMGTIDLASAFAVGEVRAMGFANGTQDARLFVFRVVSE